jgi:3'(2'), 5'-bisphosphate nucleotidase
MTSVETHLSELLGVVHEADKAVMDVYNSHSAVVQTKTDNTPVTQADIASHHILTSGMKRLFPNIPIVSEEGDVQENSQTVKQQHFWLIDPLDGTNEFLARTGQFTICVALIEDDLPGFGIVSAPALGVTYFGGPGYGSFKKAADDKPAPIHVARDRTGIVLGSRSSPNLETRVYIERHYPEHEVKVVGSQLKLSQIAEGLADAYPRINGPLHLWDLAAGHAILLGAGGSVTRPDGSPIDYHSPDLLAGDFVARS